MIDTAYACTQDSRLINEVAHHWSLVVLLVKDLERRNRVSIKLLSKYDCRAQTLFWC